MPDNGGLVAVAPNGLAIRLTLERMRHIEAGHPEMFGQAQIILDTVSKPDLVQEGDDGALMAVRNYNEILTGAKSCVVIYRETSSSDGFVVTAYMTRRISGQRRILWKR